MMAAGIAAVFSFPLTVGGAPLGALDCYRREKGALTPAQISNGRMFADIAADLIMHAQIADGVDVLVDRIVGSTHDRVEQARGITAFQLEVPVERSLELMRSHARLTLLSLDDVAGLIVDGRLRLTV